MTEVVIAGAGLTGSLAAIFLIRRGYGVRVVERRPDPRVSPSGAVDQPAVNPLAVRRT